MNPIFMGFPGTQAFRTFERSMNTHAVTTEAPRPSPTPRSRRLLLVEDNPLFVEQILEAMDRMPDAWGVEVFSEGSAAIASLESAGPPGEAEFDFDLALIDLGLPDISGIEVIRALRTRFQELPIVVISVTAAESTVLTAITAGASGYLLKTESVAEITEGIGQVLRGIYPLSPSLARHLFKQLSGAVTGPREESGVKLTARELETLQYLSQGCRYEEVAEKMGVALSTIQWNVRNLYRKLNVHSQVQAISKARSHGLL
jgi:two-component system nitrate/nitrite response regulator NarL